MNTHDFILGPVDTDSISFGKTSGEVFSEEEQKQLLIEINSYFPEFIKYDSEGSFEKIIVLKTKNYILWDGKTLKIKGSSLRDPKKEPALKEFINDIIWTIIKEEYQYTAIYLKYVKEIKDLKDIRRWVSKKTISDKTLTNTRTNEAKVREAIKDTEYTEGDRVFVFFNNKNQLVLAENFSGDYNKNKLLERLYKTSEIFSTILPENTFINYSLKRSQKALELI